MNYGTTPTEWKLQASIKLGDDQQHMINVRATTVSELLELLDSLYGSWNYLGEMVNGLGSNNPPNVAQAVDTIRAQFPDTVEIHPGVITPQTQQTYGPQPPAPSCPHGAMIYREGIGKNGQPYKAYMCPAPKGSNQCAPKFL